MVIRFCYQTLKKTSCDFRRKMSGKYIRVRSDNLTVNSVYQDFPMDNDLAFFSK